VSVGDCTSLTAFHSEMLDPILEEYREAVARVSLHPPRIPFVSNVTEPGLGLPSHAAGLLGT
jgi:acyl transferase domain-containing protein